MNAIFKTTQVILVVLAFLFCASILSSDLTAGPKPDHDASNVDSQQPWMDKSLSPDQRAELVLKEMTLDEKIQLLHGNGMPGWSGEPRPNHFLGNGGAGFVLAIPRLGLPMIQMSDAAYGVRASAQNGRYSTALPANVTSASTVGRPRESQTRRP